MNEFVVANHLSLRRLSRGVFAVICAATLAACGGGGDDAPANNAGNNNNNAGNNNNAAGAAAYAGSWTTCEKISAQSSVRRTVTFAAVNATTLSQADKGQFFNSADCSGAAVDQDDSTWNVTLKGVKAVAPLSCDKIDVASVTPVAGVTGKGLLCIDGAKLRVASDFDPGIVLDGEGYPTALRDEVYNKL